MRKNSDEFSMQEALRLANSDAGQQLLALLQTEDPQQLQHAAALAAGGDLRGAQQALSQLLQSPQIRALLRQLEE